MKHLTKTILLAALCLAALLCASGCSAEKTPYEVNNDQQYNISVKYDANGGVTAEPYLVQEVRYGDAIRYEQGRSPTHRVLSQETADRLAEIMHYAVVNNYGEWYFSGLYAGAKSGTAEQGEGDNDALFAGFSQDPDYPLAFIVIVEGGGAGSSTCTPIVKQVLDSCVVELNS